MATSLYSVDIILLYIIAYLNLQQVLTKLVTGIILKVSQVYGHYE
jgi:hypothetical protein